MRGIILDTNFLMVPITQNVDIFSELKRVCDFPFELFVLLGTVDELKKLTTNQSGKDKQAASLGMQLIAAKNIGVIDIHQQNHVDDLILKTAIDKGYFVATQDAMLRKRLKEKGVGVIFLRQKKYLVVEK